MPSTGDRLLPTEKRLVANRIPRLEYEITRINSAGALLAGRGQYSTVKNGTRMRHGTVVRLAY